MRSTGLWLDGYVRVSRVNRRFGDRFISPREQRTLIEEWARGNDCALLEVFEELDQSGLRRDRPLLMDAVGRVEAGISQGLVVARIDRFGRSVIDGLLTVERIRQAGGTFVSVQDGLDLNTDTGRLVLRIMLSMAEWEMDRMRAAWEVAHAMSIARGAYPVATVPVGYRRTRAGRLRPDPKTAGVVAELFERRATGESVPRLATWLEAQGVRTSKGNPGWRSSTLYALLRNRVYLGEVHWGTHARAGAHLPLVDPGTWQAAQRPQRVGVPNGRRSWLLAGLVRCASCSLALSPIARRQRGRVDMLYTCHGHSASGPCPKPAYITGSALEEHVEKVALDLLRRRRRPPIAELAAAHERLRTAEAGLAAYRDSDQILLTAGAATFAAGLDARERRVRDARLDVAAVAARHATHALPPKSEIDERWATTSIEERRELIAKVIDCAFVRPGRRHVEERVTVCPIGTAPRGLPHRGHKGSQAKPFNPPRGCRD